ncbi:MAG: small multi-drug export protein [Clostridia bacterium]
MNGITDAITDFFGPRFKIISVFICALLPIVELRGAVPLGIVQGIDPVITFIVAFLGNMLPIPFILLFISSILKWMKKISFLKKIVDFIENKAQKAAEKHQNLSFWGLVFFVAIPLPGTGGWTGALVADFLGIKFKKSLLAISIGVFIADVIVTLIVLFFKTSLGFLLG